MVLMRLFQTSRRFNVEIQPQLVLLQKTLLNVEGLGRQLDPDLDLWNTAKPFLETLDASSRSAGAGCSSACKNEAPRYAQLLPELPRLVHSALQRRGRRRSCGLLEALLAEQTPHQPHAAGHRSTAAWASCSACWPCNSSWPGTADGPLCCRVWIILGAKVEER